jgi:hypothetical protein
MMKSEKKEASVNKHATATQGQISAINFFNFLFSLNFLFSFLETFINVMKRILFFGTCDFAVTHLRALVNALPRSIIDVVTPPDRLRVPGKRNFSQFIH